MTLPYIKALHIGKIEQIAYTDIESSINKKVVNTPLQVTYLGLLGDEQADKKNHGGVDKAIHQYAWENYEIWKKKLPECELLKNTGAFGENITSVGMTEDTVNIGDIYKVGGCLLEVSQSRQPCWKLNYRFKYPKMSKDLQNSLSPGWYYRVLKEGTIQAGDSFQLEEIPYPQYTLSYLLDVLYKDCLNREKLIRILTINSLPKSWKQLFTQRLETGVVENWEKRLSKN